MSNVLGTLLHLAAWSGGEGTCVFLIEHQCLLRPNKTCFPMPSQTASSPLRHLHALASLYTYRAVLVLVVDVPPLSQGWIRFCHMFQSERNVGGVYSFIRITEAPISELPYGLAVLTNLLFIDVVLSWGCNLSGGVNKCPRS